LVKFHDGNSEFMTLIIFVKPAFDVLLEGVSLQSFAINLY